MHASAKIQPPSYPQFLNRLAQSPVIEPHQIARLAHTLVPHLPSLKSAEMHLLKIISAKILSQPAIQMEGVDSTALCARIDTLASSVFSYHTLFDLSLYFPEYPLEIMQTVANRICLEMFYQQLDQQSENILNKKQTQEKYDCITLNINSILNQMSQDMTKFEKYKTKLAELLQGLAQCDKSAGKATWGLVFLACKSGHLLKELSLPTYLTQEEVSTLVKNCPQLEIIRLRDWGCEEIPIEDLSLLNHLKVLELPYEHSELYLNELTSLEVLAMDCRNGFCSDLNPISHLKELQITVHQTRLSDMLKFYNFKSFSLLETLKLEIDINGKILPYYIEYLPKLAKLKNLKNLSITGISFLQFLATEVGFSTPYNRLVQLITSLPNLISLEFMLLNDSDIDHKKLKEEFPALEIKIKYCPN